MPEQLTNVGYLAVKQEATSGTPLIPDTYLPYFSENVGLNLNKNDIAPIMGLKMARYSTVHGKRNIDGNIVFLGEPNTTGYLLDMLLTKGTTSGSDPYTHPFTLSTTADPKSYTVDISKGQVVERYMGVEMSEMGIEFDDSVMKFNCVVTAKNVLSGRRITGVSTLDLTLADEYTTTPTKGFVATDVIRIFKADGSVIDTTVTSVTEGTDIIAVGSATGVASGDYVALRKSTPSLSLSGNYFTKERTEFRFADTAANALTATQTKVDSSSIKVMHGILPPTNRSGARGIASIVRGTGDVETTTKIYFDTLEDHERFTANSKRAVVIRAFAGSTNQHELRITLNQTILKAPTRPIDINTVIFQDIAWVPEYKDADAQGFDVKIINAVATI